MTLYRFREIPDEIIFTIYIFYNSGPTTLESAIIYKKYTNNISRYVTNKFRDNSQYLEV